MATTVLVSRLWNAPDIAITVTDDGIGIEIELEKFLAALAAEMGNPTLLVTRAQLAAKVQEAATVVVAQMKQETVRVM